ncbi:MAG: DUF4303 domain-containing protein [Lachnospiraceae bacterium]|jgi:hypothetical protein|nr:DUF4303 domain-containing protein [Lachnospiraceae bacterium]MCI8826390.1 DUF4303 domain-containing protein [Lachnospiraceae bacterium]MCI9371153.1 DUF4303 domain-containing protein [Lachnospiraceae bacterium]
MNFKESLISELMKAIRTILLDLMKNKEHYYYITLVSDGLANTPYISAWSMEALEREKENGEEELEMIKWSDADSPYCMWKQENFKEVEALLYDRGSILDMDFEKEYELRYSAMEQAMKTLDREGIFALNQSREDVIVLVEVMSPDYTNTERAYRLNNPDTKIFAEWLAEAAEKKEDYEDGDE